MKEKQTIRCPCCGKHLDLKITNGKIAIHTYPIKPYAEHLLKSGLEFGIISHEKGGEKNREE